jgi:phage-related protein
MAKIIFYENGRGEEPVREWFESLTSGKTRNDALLAKIIYQMRRLENEGSNLKMPTARFLKKQEIPLWELRPKPERILYAALDEDQKGDEVLILLHHFTKKRDDTPQKELDIAINRYKDYIQRKESKNGYLERF